MTSEKYFKKLMKESGKKQQWSLENIKKVCDLLEENGVAISIASVGRELERQGLSPRTQTIRNNSILKSFLISRQSIEVPHLNYRTNLSIIKQLTKENLSLKKIIKKMSHF